MTRESTLLGFFVREGRLRSGWRLALYLFIYLTGLLVVQTPVVSLYVAVLMSQGVETLPALLEALQPGRLPIWFYLVLKVAELSVLLPLTFLFRRLLDRRTWVSLGFRRNHGWVLDMLLGLALGGTPMLLIFGVEWSAGWLSVGLPDSTVLAQRMVNSLAATGLFALVAFSEELLFRGYVQVNLTEGFGRWSALFVTSLIFSLSHGLNPNVSWLALVNIALAGLAMGYCQMVTGNLWLPMAYHFGWNFFQGVFFSLPVSGVRYGGMLSVTDAGIAPLVTGTTFGPEGGTIGTLVLLCTFPVLWWWGRGQRATPKQERIKAEPG